MIQYALRCEDGHSFDSWFQSAAGFDKLRAAGLLACAVCGTAKVDKAVMAPRVAVSSDKPASSPRRPGPLSAPASAAEQALARLRAHVEANSDDVGRDFVTEARAIHEGRAPERAIRGEARLDEARELLDDGVPVAPLPFLPKNRTN